MSVGASILICPVVDLRQLPPAEVDVIRRFLFDHIRGMDRTSEQRWRRLWGIVWNAGEGEGIELLHKEGRGGPFHRRHRAILQRLFDAQERFRNVDRLHDYLKYGAGFVEWTEGRQPGLAWPKPRSTAFDKCSEDEMREFHAAAVEFLHTERAQRFLWRHIKAKDRQAMLDAVLANPEDDAP